MEDDSPGLTTFDGCLYPRQLAAARLALRALAEARRVLDRLEPALVENARREGATWSEIASDLGLARTTLSRRRRGFARVGVGE